MGGLAMNNPNKGLSKEALKSELISRIGYCLAQYGTQQWILEAINEAMENVEKIIESMEGMDDEVLRLRKWRG
jgi:hypothetical protein